MFKSESDRDSLTKATHISYAARSVLIISICLIILFPMLLKTGAEYDFLVLGKNSSEIGDAIGGATAPIVGVLNAILVYFALAAQVKANTEVSNRLMTQEEDAKKALEYKYLYELILELKRNINSFHVDNLEDFKLLWANENSIFFVVHAMRNYGSSHVWSKYENKINEFRDLIVLCSTIVGVIEEKDLDISQKVHLNNLLGLTFSKEVTPAFKKGDTGTPAYHDIKEMVLEIRLKLGVTITSVDESVKKK